MNLNRAEQTLHDRAVGLGRDHRAVESHIVIVIQKIEDVKLHRKLRKSLFDYVVSEMLLSESVAGTLITVARKAKTIAPLQSALIANKLSVSKASRIVSSLTVENADSWIAFAVSHTENEINREVAKRHPGKRPRDKVKFISDDVVQLTISISKEAYENFKRAESIEAQKGKGGSMGDTFAAVTDVYLNANDPVRKAKRYARRKSKSAESCVNSVTVESVGAVNEGEEMSPKICACSARFAMISFIKWRCHSTAG